ncbi:MFS transporter [Acuticoccus mangrovi]|uniref:MFS transporter n=1 Tax=Acuticoccus mangrovi TaxID=2796142 RepID=A0A934IRR6_9HYPH|nr:MFS transporter [Acuticoccus mangrovi]MBJ3777546.1 MFS transporter [Acuticoccus mangrovi]
MTERDARVVNTRHEDVNPADIAVGVIIGRTSEFFDFFVFAIASVIVFPTRVFPYVDPLTATLYCFAIFALAFVARPFGSALFMAIDRAYGKSAKLTVALFMLGSATVALGFLPAYDVIGRWSAVILIILRILQGLALGGSWDGLASLLALNAPEGRRGLYAMVPQLGAAVGFLVASGLFAYFVAILSPADFYDWGWRYPFFVAFAINVVALFARLRIVVTPEYTRLFDARELRPEPIFAMLRNEGRTVVIGAFTPLATFALFHMVTVFPLSWIFLYTKERPWQFLTIEAAGAVVFMLAIIASGLLADRYGRRRVLWICAALTAAFSGFAPQLLDVGFIGEIWFMFSGFALLGITFGQSSGAVASGFSQKYRYTGSAVTSDLAWLVGAGFAPLVALFLASQFGLIAAGAYLLSGALVTLLALRLSDRWGIVPAPVDQP